MGLGQYLEALQDPQAKTFTAVLDCPLSLTEPCQHQAGCRNLHFPTISVKTGIWNVDTGEKERSKQPTVLDVWTWQIGFCIDDPAKKQRKSVQPKISTWQIGLQNDDTAKSQNAASSLASMDVENIRRGVKNPPVASGTFLFFP